MKGKKMGKTLRQYAKPLPGVEAKLDRSPVPFPVRRQTSC